MKNRWFILGILFLVFYYAVGLKGFIQVESRVQYARLIPLSLLMTSIILLIFQKELNFRKLVVFVSIAVISFFVEVIGVKTGYIFGHYSYGPSLGYSLWDTPLIIGLNWLMMVICANSLATLIIPEDGRKAVFLRSLTGGFFMVLYDLVLERVAPQIQMWYWKNAVVPVQNYIAWFVCSVLIIAGYNLLVNRRENKMGAVVYLIQYVFFLVLNFVFLALK